ncbi:MAG: DUF2339 domain-containing protein, partial [Actinomycetota bacterium]
MSSPEDLLVRVARLEQHVADLRAAMSARPAQSLPPSVGRPDLSSLPPPPPAPFRPASPAAPLPVERPGLGSTAPDVEDQVVGTWFPRVGAMAVVLGAGFAFAYAVQRGWIGPAARLGAAVAAGAGAIVAADRLRTRGWTAPAQAMAGGGVGLLYLAVWAASRLYGYVPVPAGLALLCGVAVLCAWLALRHDSQALALIAFAAGVVNPFAMGGPFDDRALLPYIVA